MFDLMTAIRGFLPPLFEGPADDQVLRIYWGSFADFKYIIGQHTRFLMVDIAGEDTNEGERVGSIQVKLFNVRYVMGVQHIDGEDSMFDILRRWRRLEEILFTPDNRQILGPQYMISEEIQRFPSVEDDEIEGEDFPAFRVRGATVPYRRPVCRGGYYALGT